MLSQACKVESPFPGVPLVQNIFWMKDFLLIREQQQDENVCPDSLTYSNISVQLFHTKVAMTNSFGIDFFLMSDIPPDKPSAFICASELIFIS